MLLDMCCWLVVRLIGSVLCCGLFWLVFCIGRLCG